MSFPTTSVLDQFSGANEDPITTNWSTMVSVGQRIVSNQMRMNSASFSSSYYDLQTFGPDCENFITISTKQANGHSVYLYARLQQVGSAAVDGYVLRVIPNAGGDTIELGEMLDGAITSLGSTTAYEIASGDKIGIRCVGTLIQAWLRPVSTGVWSNVLTASDATYTSAGYLGVGGSGASAGLYDDWGGGTYVAPAFPTTSVLDDFNRANNASSLGANWTAGTETGYGSLGVNTNQAYPAAVFKGNYWSAELFGASQEAFCTVAVVPTYSIRLWVRLTNPGTSGLTGYRLAVAASGTGTNLYKYVSGVATYLAEDYTDVVAGDKIGLTVTGNEIRAYLYKGSWSQIMSVSDAAIGGSGYIAVDIGNETTARVDDFGGGNITVPSGGSSIAGRMMLMGVG